MDYVQDIHNLPGLERAFREAPGIVADELVAAAWESELLLERETKELTPVGVGGTLRSSVAAREPKVLADNVIGEVGTPLKYAIPVELGTKPHFPPIAPLVEWAERKLGLSPNEAHHVGFLIQRKIGRKGTEGAFMFKRAFEAGRGQVERFFENAAARIVERMGRMA